MIALIVLFAVAVVLGLVIGFIAIIIALTKAIVRGIRRHCGLEAIAAPTTHQTGPAHPADVTDREFLRLMSAEWPDDDRG